MADASEFPPAVPRRGDAYPHIYVDDTDAELPKYQTTGFGRYTDFKPLAKGGTATLRTCRDKSLGRTVVMKTLHPHLANHPYQQARFLREARVTAQLQHPTTVPVYDLGRDMEGHLYFTMKKVVGDTLREIIESQISGDAAAIERYNLERLLGALIQACNGLAYAHAHGVVHRDVKPENILIGSFGEVIILDWGVAKVWAMEQSQDGTHSHEILTDVNQRPGTPLYMSPEQVRGGGDIDARTDVYSIGAVLYEVLTLAEPFRGARISETFEMIVKSPPAPPRQRAPQRHIPPELAAIAMQALEKDPARRHASMLEMIDAMHQFRNRALQSLSDS
jgi:serine/threonine-protein kinase